MALKNYQKRPFFNGLSILGFFLLFFFLGSVICSAQESKIAITPLVFEFTAEPGETVEGFFRISNYSENARISILVEIEDIFPEGEEGRVRLEAPTHERRTFSLSSWINVEPSEFLLEPREERRVNFKINIPENAEPGGYYVSVVAGTADKSAGQTGVAIITRIGAIILMTVPGAVEEKLTAIEMKAPSYLNSGPVDFSVRFENSGTVHVRPDSLIVVTDMFGRKVAEVPLENRNVLPGAIRRIDASWDSKILWGKYTATLKGFYGTRNLPINVISVTFWGFPWRIIAVVVAILIFFFLTRKRWLAALRILIKG